MFLRANINLFIYYSRPKSLGSKGLGPIRHVGDAKQIDCKARAISCLIIAIRYTIIQEVQSITLFDRFELYGV